MAQWARAAGRPSAADAVTLEMGGPRAEPDRQGAWVQFEGTLDAGSLTVRGRAALSTQERGGDGQIGYRVVASQPVTLRKISNAQDYPADTCDRDY